MPVHDWQFWVVTLLALGGAWLVAKPFLPKRRSMSEGDPSCPTCASGSAASRKTKRRVPLTIEKRRI
jgi:hypothetical protein